MLQTIFITEEALNNVPPELAHCPFRGVIGLLTDSSNCIFYEFTTDFVIGLVFWWVVVLLIWFISSKVKKVLQRKQS